MARVELVNIRKSFGAVKAVHGADVVFEEGSFTTLLGPSGCGKTTILRMISGLESPTGGDILIGERRINDVPIHKRNLGLVFQNYALFPHRTIGENIAFGLKYRNVSKSDVAQKVKDALDIVRLPNVEDRYPSQLSGGQQQRIALARAIVIEPDVLLLDEPLSALDANLREDMRVELKAIQDRIGVTSIFVTHDQSEALAMSDKIIVMSAGRIEQIGTPEEVYNTPASSFVAGFLGASNKPSPISQKEAEALMKQIQEGVESPRPSITFDIGEEVKVADGPFASFNGLVEEIDEEKGKLKVSVSIFGRATPVELEYSQVEKT